MIRLPSPRWWIALLLAAQGALTLFAIAQTPLFENRTDEIGHVAMARYVAQNLRLPDASEFSRDTERLQYTQPPLFYLISAPLVWLLDDGQVIPGQPTPQPICHAYNANLTHWTRPRDFNLSEFGVVRLGYGLRMLLLGMMLLATAFTYGAARLLLPNRPGIALAAVAMLAFMPAITPIITAVNNDIPVLLLGAAALYVSAIGVSTANTRTKWVCAGGLLLLSVLALLTKASGWALFAFTVPVAGYLTVRARVSRRFLLIGAGVLVLGIAGVLLFNVTQYGSLIGRYPTQWLQGRMALGDVVGPALTDLWGSLNNTESLNAIPIRGLARLEQATFALIALGAMALLFQLRDRDMRRAALITGLLVIAALGLALARNFILSLNPFLIYAPLRYLAPGIPALALLVALALGAFPGMVGRVALVVIPAVWLTLNVLLLTLTPLATTARNTVIASLPASATPVEIDQTGQPLHIAGYEIAPGDTFDDGLLDLRLYITSDNPPETVYALELSANDSRCTITPTGGLHTSSALRPGEITAAHITLPYCGSATEAETVEITFAWQPSNSTGRLADDLAAPPAALVSVPGESLRRADACFANLGAFGGLFQAIKTDIPAEFDAAGTVTLSVNWWVLAATEDSYARIYQLRDRTGDITATCAGLPRRDSYPTHQWQRGEVIYFDECETAAPNAQPGETYSVWVGWQGVNDGPRLTAEDGEAFVQIGTTTAR